MNAIAPPPLAPSDRVRVVAPAGSVPAGRLQAGIATLGGRYQIAFDDEITSSTGFLAGTDEQRTAELQQAIDDRAARALVAARGGYGTSRIVDRVRFESLVEDPRWIVGSSDITVLLVQLFAVHRLQSIHGPMAIGLAQSDDDTRRLFDLLEGKGWVAPGGLQALAEGQAHGPLVGGNLTVLAHLAGTVDPAFAKGCVLFLEDIGERPYRIDRCLTQLRRSGMLEQVAGVVLGEFTDCDPGDDGASVEQVLAERLGDLGIPVATGYPAAHGDRNAPFVHGAPVELVVAQGGVKLAADPG